jgi:membrane dipeptidase
MQSPSRRAFLKNSIGALGCVTLADVAGFVEADELVFDLHAHPAYFFAKGSDKYPGAAAFDQSIQSMLNGKLTGAFFSMVADALIISVGPDGVTPSRNFSAGEAWADYKRQMNALQALLAKQQNAFIATQSTQHMHAARAKKVAAYVSCEGGDYLEGDAGKLELMYQDGVRSVQLVHYHPNELGDLQTGSPQHKGLSNAGKLVVKRMNELGMVIDLAHATYETTRDAISTSQQPIIISHTLLHTGSTLPIARRMISKEHALLIKSNGGVIGAWPSGLNKDLDDFIDNIKRLIDVVGVDHVGIGTDMDANFKPVLTNYTQWPTLSTRMKAKGFKATEIKKVMGQNMHRVLTAVLK